MTATESILDTLFGQVEVAAAALADEGLRRGIVALQEHTAQGQVRVLVVGRTGTGRASIVNALLAAPDLLPVTPIPRPSVSIVVGAGVTERIEMVGVDGLKATVTPAQLRAALRAPVTPARVTVTTPSPLLAGLEFQLETLTGEDEVWRVRLETVNFVILVLDAAALLSHAERSFVRDHLLPFGLGRVAIIVNGLDRVPEEEREAVIDAARRFLGMQDEAGLVLPLSARYALAALRSGESSPDLAALTTLREDIVEASPRLRVAALRHALDDLLTALERVLAVRRADLTIDRTRLREVRAMLESERATIERRTARVQQRAQTFTTILIKERLRKEIGSFAAMLSRRLPEDILSVGDARTVRRYLPGYLQFVWSDTLSRLSLAIEYELREEAALLERMVAADLRELLGEAAELEGVVTAVESLTGIVRPVVMPRRGRHPMSGMMRGLDLHSYFMLIFNPALGALSLAAGHVLRRVFAGGLERAELDALATVGEAALAELRRELERRIDAEFALLAAELSEEIDATYRRALDRAAETIDRLTADAEDLTARKAALDEIERTAIPALRRTIADLAGTGV